jgi:hypothetical protein
MNSLDYWRLCDELSILQAVLLVLGCDPSDPWDKEAPPAGYEGAKTAISNALRLQLIAGKIIPIYEFDMNGNPSIEVPDSIDIEHSRVEVESLKLWLAGRGLKTGFFFPEVRDLMDFLNPAHPRYASKLAAAVLAWRATASDESANIGKSPKQALMKWLREHAAEFGLTDDDGKPNETGIEEAAKVANWQPTGGAPKTPA